MNGFGYIWSGHISWPGPESQGHGLWIFVLQVYHIFANPLMDLVHIWHDDRCWFKHFLCTIYNHLVMYKQVRCPWGGHVCQKSSKRKTQYPGSILNRNLRWMTRHKARLYCYPKKSKQWSEFKQYQKLCKKEFKKAEVDYVNKTIEEGFGNNNSKPFWHYVNAKREDNNGVAPLKVKGASSWDYGTFRPP